MNASFKKSLFVASILSAITFSAQAVKEALQNPASISARKDF